MPNVVANLASFRTALAEVCHEVARDPRGVTLVAVTKQRSVAEINSLIEAGVTTIGENRVQEALQKFPNVLSCEHHFIGHLQTNKVPEVVANFDCVESVDSFRLAEKLSIECGRVGKTLPIFLQVNLAEETTKSGFTLANLRSGFPKIQKLPHLKIIGLMVIGPHVVDVERIQKIFSLGKQLVDELALPYFSAGMSADWPLAVRTGATHLRIGSLLFEKPALDRSE